jgi:hypothetical protein
LNDEEILKINNFVLLPPKDLKELHNEVLDRKPASLDDLQNFDAIQYDFSKVGYYKEQNTFIYLDTETNR